MQKTTGHLSTFLCLIHDLQRQVTSCHLIIVTIIAADDILLEREISYLQVVIIKPAEHRGRKKGKTNCCDLSWKTFFNYSRN
jgi:hypothetical protein